MEWPNPSIPRTALGLGVAASALSTPAWAIPDPPAHVQLAHRTVTADAHIPLPAAPATFYLFTARALARAERDTLQDHALSYLGVVGRHVYAFHRREERPEQSTLLAEAPYVVGTAAAEPLDRFDRELGPLWHRQTEPPLPVAVTFYATTPAEEAALLTQDSRHPARWPVNPRAPVGAERFVVVDASFEQLDALAHAPWVASMRLLHPRSVRNDDSRALARADALFAAPFGLSGSGIVVGHWDGGRVARHDDLIDRVDNRDNGPVDEHATHTAGTILGDGSGRASAQGFAPRATMVAFDFEGDIGEERRAAKHTHGHAIDNHSYGSISTEYGTYDQEAEEFDADARDLLMLGIRAAGNEGDLVRGGYNSLPPDSTAKNILVVGATDEDGDLLDYSSQGPTEDGRVKPDLCANGQDVQSSVPDDDYDSFSGTSMSAPAVTGIGTLLAELYRQQYGLPWAPDMARAVLIHSAADAGNPGPDYRYGWGNADARAGAELILAAAQNPGQILIRGAVREAEVAEYPVEVPPGAAVLKVTLGWLDTLAATTNRQRVIHNLDLELVRPRGAIELPFSLDGANPSAAAVRSRPNTADNVEQVRIAQPEPGIWTIRVRGTSVSDPDLPVQGYVLTSNIPVDRAIERVLPAWSTTGASIPDANPSGLEIPFGVTDPRPVKKLRVRLDIRHPRRGQLEVRLSRPDGRSVTLERADDSTRRDIYAIYPDLRSYDDDVTDLVGDAASGTWTLTVIDTIAGSTGEVLYAQLELELGPAITPPENTAPFADAGKDAEVRPAEFVMLDGSLSYDADGDALEYTWLQTRGPAVTINNANAPAARFIAPLVDERTELGFQLTVRDPSLSRSTDDVTVLVVPEALAPPDNRPPLAHAGSDQVVEAGAVVQLDGRASIDPDGDALSMTWAQIEGAAVGLDAPLSVAPSFTAPRTAQILRFRLLVTDRHGATATDDVLVTIRSGRVEPPSSPEPARDSPSNARDGAAERGCRHVAIAQSSPLRAVVLGLLLVTLAAIRVRRPSRKASR